VWFDGLNLVLQSDTSVRLTSTSLDHDDDDPVFGAMAAVRYLGRLSRTYPTTPQTALRLDEALDDLQMFLVQIDRGLEEVILLEMLQSVEKRFNGTDVWMGGFERMTILDVCWAGVIRWLFERHVYTSESMKKEFPQLNVWWTRLADGDDCDDCDEPEELQAKEEVLKKTS
jgi:glutathione S-transferase